jgi:dienelactone hydrolase
MMRRSSWLDRAYVAGTRHRRLLSDGWGPAEQAARWLADPARLRELDAPLVLDPPTGWSTHTFTSPLPDLAGPVATVHIGIERPSEDAPLVLHLPATGDEGLEGRRVSLAAPLAAAGVGSVIVEAPFYGARRAYPDGSPIRTVAELLWLGTGAIVDALVVLRALRRSGHRVLLAGVSMGGQLAATAAALDDAPTDVAALIPSHAADVVFLDGCMRQRCDWAALGGAETARTRLRALLAASDLRRLPPPPRASRAHLLAAAGDAYIPRWSSEAIATHWGADLTLLDGGHVAAWVRHKRRHVDGIIRLASPARPPPRPPRG